MNIKAIDYYRNKEIKNILSIHFSRLTGKPNLIVYTDKKINPLVEIKPSDKIYCNEFTLEVEP